MNFPSGRPFPKPNPVLKELEIMVGQWNLVGSHPVIPGSVHGHASFEWVGDGAFLSWHTDFEQTGPPSRIAVIGRDDSVDTYSILYFDERGVSRIYEMSLMNGIWKMWRNAPGFSQRMTGTVIDDRSTIMIHWEKSSDGSIWEPDLDLTYTKVR
jgi:hypothetical protein